MTFDEFVKLTDSRLRVIQITLSELREEVRTQRKREYNLRQQNRDLRKELNELHKLLAVETKKHFPEIPGSKMRKRKIV